MIKAIFFDMGGVLLPLHLDKCIAAYREFAGFTDIDKYLDPCHQHGLYLELESGAIDLDTFFSRCLEHCRPGTTKETIIRCHSAFFGTPDPDDVRLVKELGSRYDVCMLSNNNALSMLDHIPNFERAGLPLYSSFKHLFLSHEMHLLKPAPEIYLRAIKESGHNADEILFIDDSPKNVEGGLNVGIKAVLYDRNATTLRQLVQSNL